MRTPTVALILKQVETLFEGQTGAPMAPAIRTHFENLLSDAITGAVGVSREERFRPHEVTVLLTDLRGFTSISEQHDGPTLLDMLNRYLVRMTEIAVSHGGTIDKFMGDAVMVLFGAPVSHGDDAYRAVHCAVDMQRALLEMNQENRSRKLPELNMGIGINSGAVIAGLLGSDLHAEYTVIGDEVNLASRIEAYSLRGQVLISDATRRLVEGRVDLGEPMPVYVKGKREQVHLHEVLGIPSLDKPVPRQEVRKSPRVETRMPFEYERIQNKAVVPGIFPGTILDIGYHGALAELTERVPAHADLKLHLHFVRGGAADTDLYARVVRTFEREGRPLACLEFTSVSPQGSENIRRFVQMLLQAGGDR
ncbi:MAG: adenylate cyclase [Planctomycetes bacterium]|nr:adenylate cyclase [Planctomycetota bacterium]